MTHPQVLDSYFMDARSKLIDLAAFLDRATRAEGQGDHRMTGFVQALQELRPGQSDNARRVLLAFSDPTTEPVSAAGTKGASGAWPGLPQP